MNPMDFVKIARAVKRPQARDYIDLLFTDFFELHGDRNFSDDGAVIGGVARFEGRPITVLGIQKGKNTQENIQRGFGSPHPEGYRKALRLMKQAEKFGRPVITFINTAGAACDVGAEERGQGEAIARNLMEMSGLNVPIISILIGEGGSGGALALAVADEVWVLQNAVYSILSPEGFASILWKDAKRAPEAASLMRLTAEDLLELNIVELIIPEIPEGAEHNISVTVEALHRELKRALSVQQTSAVMLQKRYERFRAFGQFAE